MNEATLPEEMTSRRQWITWQDVDGTKIPNGRSNAPDDWKEFSEIEIFDNIAFVFSADDPFTGIDLDGCIVDGAYTDWAKPILERFQGVAYGEVSPSGTGVKLTTKAKKPQGTRCKHKVGDDKQQIECYDNRRFWTVTKDIIPGFETIGDGQASIDWLCEKYLSTTTTESQASGTKRTEPYNGTSPLSLLQRAQAYADKMQPASKGDLRDSAFRNAGHLHAIVGQYGERLTDNDVYHLLRAWNTKNTPQLRDDELLEAAKNGRKNGTPPPDKMPNEQPDPATPFAGENNRPEAHKTFEGIRPVSIGDLIDRNPDLRPVIIDGILRRGETANIIAAAKIGKSFLAGGLAWCIATGASWLSHKVIEGRVLIIDNELHPETLASRLYRIATDMMIDYRDYRDRIDIISLRGQNIDIHAIQSRLSEITPGTYALAIVDALYRTLPSGTSENDNAAMMAIYNRLDFYANSWDCAVAVVHHASKGQQGDKSVTDVGSGAGSISRAADTHIVIRPHEDPELSVMECVTRSFKSPDPVSIRFTWPLWESVSVDPQVKKATRQNTEKQAEDDKKAMAELLAKIPETPKSIQQANLFERFGFGESKCRRLMGRLVSENKVQIKRKRKKGARRALVFYTRSSESSSE